jgi:MFS family permease
MNGVMVTKFIHAIPKRAFILFGFLIMSLACVLIGTFPNFGVPQNPEWVAIGAFFYGLALPMVIVPMFPELLEGVENAFPTIYGPTASPKVLCDL